MAAPEPAQQQPAENPGGEGGQQGNSGVHRNADHDLDRDGPRKANAGLSSATAAIIDNCAHVRRRNELLLADTDLGDSAEAVSEPPLCRITGEELQRCPVRSRPARLPTEVAFPGDAKECAVGPSRSRQRRRKRAWG